MNNTIQLRHLIDYLRPKVGSPITVTLHGGTQISGTLALVDVSNDTGGYSSTTLVRIAATGGVVHQVDPTNVVAVGITP